MPRKAHGGIDTGMRHLLLVPGHICGKPSVYTVYFWNYRDRWSLVSKATGEEGRERLHGSTIGNSCKPPRPPVRVKRLRPTSPVAWVWPSSLTSPYNIHFGSRGGSTPARSEQPNRSEPEPGPLISAAPGTLHCVGGRVGTKTFPSSHARAKTRRANCNVKVVGLNAWGCQLQERCDRFEALPNQPTTNPNTPPMRQTPRNGRSAKGCTGKPCGHP